MGGKCSTDNKIPLETVANCETSKFMGTWFVHGVIPTFLETTCSNAVETYTYVGGDLTKKHDIDIGFDYNKGDPLSSPLKSANQKGWVQGDDKKNSGLWQISPFAPVKIDYLILEVDEVDYEYTVIGVRNRKYAWVMGRKPSMEEETFEMLKERLVTKHGYTLEGFRIVPQVWTEAERSKRKLESAIPDKYLTLDI